MLTEAQVQRSFSALLSAPNPGPDVYDRAEALIEELRPESPLRHRLTAELEEIRQLRQPQA